MDPTEIRDFLSYDPDSGIFRWKKSTYRRGKPGARAGTVRKRGYRQINLFGIRYPAAQVAFALMTGEWPEAQIDHINHIRDDDRWCNLRPATQSQNNANWSMRSDNKSGYRGVSWDVKKGLWVVHLKNQHIGATDDPIEGAKLYDRHAREMFGEYANLNFPKGTV